MMKSYLYKWRFRTPVHFGKANGLLSDSGSGLCADTIFSAILEEALAYEGVEKLENLVKIARGGQLRLSDALPFRDTDKDECYFIPSPYLPVQPEFQNSRDRKTYKNIRCLRASQLKKWCDELSAPSSEFLQEVSDATKGLYTMEVRTGVNLTEEIPRPYSIGTCSFSADSGLYVLVQADETIQETIRVLFESLSYTGIGGKRRSGLGKFELEDAIDLSEPYVKDLEVLQSFLNLNSGTTQYMSLSLALPKEDELDESLEGAHYRVLRRGGFTDSQYYANAWLRRKDFYAIEAGSIFKKQFKGSVYDLAVGGKHPLYRYAAPLFMEVPL